MCFLMLKKGRQLLVQKVSQKDCGTVLKINLYVKNFIRSLKMMKSDTANLKESEIEILELKNIVQTGSGFIPTDML